MLLLLTFVFLLPGYALATESVVCGGEQIELFLYFGMGDLHFAGFALYINGNLEDPQKWQVENITINFTKQSLLFSAVTISPPRTEILMRASAENGDLKIGKKNHKLSCDWSAFAEDSSPNK